MAKAFKSTLKTEYFAGDCLKVIGEICHQLSDFNKLQNVEIVAVIKSELERKGLPNPTRSKRRPAARGIFVTNYHSGNELTRSRVRKEPTLAARLAVIYQECCELALYDGLLKEHILALIESYLTEHIVEVDV